MLQKYVAKFGDKMFEKDLAKIVRKHAMAAAIVLFFPTFGLGMFIFLGILWHMYSELCKKCRTQLKLGTVIVGMLVNTCVAGVVDFAFEFIPVLGWLGTSFVVYVQFYLSGKAFIEVLRS